MTARSSRFGSGLAIAGFLAACVPVSVVLSPPAPADVLPPMRWDHRSDANAWTTAALTAVARHDKTLAARVPKDIAAWCPGYADASLENRRAFWVGMMSVLARYESNWNPAAVGGRGKWFGLMQISPSTAHRNRCAAQSGAALKDGSANLACAVQIFARDVARDGVVAGGGNRGMGRQWSPFRKAARRAEMSGWIRAQPYCKT